MHPKTQCFRAEIVSPCFKHNVLRTIEQVMVPEVNSQGSTEIRKQRARGISSIIPIANLESATGKQILCKFLSHGDLGAKRCKDLESYICAIKGMHLPWSV